MHFAFCILIPYGAAAEVTAEPSERGAVVKLDGDLFAQYLIQAGAAPAMWPVIGPTGSSMTRSFPVGMGPPGETKDHPHHQSFWFAHDQVNGWDFWKANSGKSNDENSPQIRHLEFDAIESAGATARIATRNEWLGGNRRVCEDQRTIVFGARENGDRWIDFTITLKASDGDVTFGDTKEGTFAVRVADSMRVEAKRGGQIVNSEGQVNDDAWGMPARWVDYTGPIGNEILGIAIMSHPTSFRPVPRWHVRSYGLFTANPFGEADFPHSPSAKQGAVTIKHGDSLTLRYRVLLHRGRTEEANIEAAFTEFAAD